MGRGKGKDVKKDKGSEWTVGMEGRQERKEEVSPLP